jgi:hypothetical protein
MIQNQEQKMTFRRWDEADFVHNRTRSAFLNRFLSPGHTMSTPSRSLSLAGASNFRDLGGYIGHDGRPVRWRTLFRSDHLAALTPDDQAALARLGLARAFDFRGVHERACQRL